MISSVCTGFFCVRKPQVVIGTSPQLLAGISGWALAALKRAPFVFEVRDLWPESIEAVGALHARLLLAPLYTLVDFLYRRARHIVVVSESAKEVLVDRGISEKKISIMKNGVDLEMFRPDQAADYIRVEHGLGESFVVLYIGTLGMAHGLEVVLEAAETLKADNGIKFMLVGEGARKDYLKERAGHLPNVIFADGCPRSKVRDYIAASNVCLVHLIKSDLFKTVLPSKMFEIMGCGKPILLGVDGEARRTLEQAGGGVWFPPEDSASLAGEVSRLRADPSLCERLGANGRHCVEQNYSREVIAKSYAKLLKELV